MLTCFHNRQQQQQHQQGTKRSLLSLQLGQMTQKLSILVNCLFFYLFIYSFFFFEKELFIYNTVA